MIPPLAAIRTSSSIRAARLSAAAFVPPAACRSVSSASRSTRISSSVKRTTALRRAEHAARRLRRPACRGLLLRARRSRRKHGAELPADARSGRNDADAPGPAGGSDQFTDVHRSAEQSRIAGAVALAHARASECHHGRARRRGERPAVPSARRGRQSAVRERRRRSERSSRTRFASRPRSTATSRTSAGTSHSLTPRTIGDSRAGHPDRQSAARACRLRRRELHGQRSGAPMAASSSIRSRPASRRTS